MLTFTWMLNHGILERSFEVLTVVNFYLVVPIP